MNKLISMANNKNGTENNPQDCPKKKSPANTTAKLPEKKNDTAKIHPKQNSSKKSQNELRPVFRFPLLFRPRSKFWSSKCLNVFSGGFFLVQIWTRNLHSTLLKVRQTLARMSVQI